MVDDRFAGQRLELSRIYISFDGCIETISIEDFEPVTKARQFLWGEPLNSFLYFLQNPH